MSVNDKLTAIADAIREKTGNTDKLTLDRMAEEIRDIGIGDDYYNKFWDAFQNDVVIYSYLFAGRGWSDLTFAPKYDITVGNTSAIAMFSNTKITDLEAILERQGVTLDISLANRADSMFSDSRSMTVIPALVLGENLTNATGMFFGCRDLKIIRSLTLPEKAVKLTNAFGNCANLEEIELVGKLLGDLDLQWSTKLSRNSIESVLTAADESVFVEGGVPHFTVTLPLVAVNKAFETSEGANDGIESDWWKSQVENTSSYYTIALI